MSRSVGNLRLRRSVQDLSGRDVARLRNAFRAMMDREGEGGYQHWAGIHGVPSMKSRHGEPAFLPWHRVYVTRFEEALRRFDARISLPWWDWIADPGIPPAFADAEAGGRPNPLYAAPIEPGGEDGPDAGDFPLQTSREPGSASQLPGEDMVRQVLESDGFEVFAKRLERLHNHIHAWVGGTNGVVSLAAYDPFFWVYQASIDRIWFLWQMQNQAAAPSDGLSEQELSPFGVSVAEVWEPEKLGYAYADPGTGSISEFLAGAASDQPATSDSLGFAQYAQAFAEIITSKDTMLPLTIGIYGPWGMGKSSLLKMIEERCMESDVDGIEVRVVDFNAWHYNSSETIWPALVRRVMEEMEESFRWGKVALLPGALKRNIGREWRLRRIPLVVGLISLLVFAVVAAFALDFNSSLIVAAVAALGVSGTVKLISDVVNNPVSKWVTRLAEPADYGEELPYMKEIRADLESLYGQMSGDGEELRILVMIDDLDRCEPEKAVEVLQAVNQLLDFPFFVVCLGIDARIITAAVEAHYKKLLGDTSASGYEYLEKIVQIPFRIPHPAHSDIEALFSAQMPIEREKAEDETESKTDAPARPSPAAFLEKPDLQQLVEERRAALAREAEIEDAPPPTKFEEAEVEAFQQLAPYIRSNPRHIKRLVNVYRMIRTLAAIDRSEDILNHAPETIAWVVICAQWPYSVSRMLLAFEPYVLAAKGGDPYPEEPALTFLHDACREDLEEELLEKLDWEMRPLREMLQSTEISWDLLASLQRLTLNFNPAIEEAAYRGSRTSSPEPAVAAGPQSGKDRAGR